MAYEHERFTTGFGAITAVAGASVVAGLFEGARECRAADQARRNAEVALANRRAAVSARARLDVARKTVAELRELLAAAMDDMDVVMTENSRLRAAVTARQPA